MANQRKPKEIAYQDGTIAREDLPRQIVLYPGHYGTFFGFQSEDHSPILIPDYPGVTAILRERKFVA